MPVKNIMEDLVSSTIDEIIKEEKYFAGIDEYKQDISAYVLNRVPPRYITSERGILHGKLESRFLFQQKTDIILLIHEALDVIKNRRDAPTPSELANNVDTRDVFFPHIIGEVLEETTFSIIPDVEVTLLFNNLPAKMIDLSWENPYKTGRGTLGYYHFWPDPDATGTGQGKEAAFSIRFRHPMFEEKEFEVIVKTTHTFNIADSRPVQIALLHMKEGNDISFLYE
jgi:competence protein ComFB